MSTTMQLSDLRTAAQQYADMVNGNFIVTAEWNFYINQSIFELYDILVQQYGDSYYENPTPYTFTTDGINQTFALPSGFFKLTGVDLKLANQADSLVTLKRFTEAERNRFAVPNFQSFYGITNLRYRLLANNIWLTPIPVAGQQIQIRYVPSFTTLVNDSDTFDGISGWTEYVIIDVAIKALRKEESNPQWLYQAKQDIIKRIQSAAANRDAANPMCVADTQWGDLWWPTGSGSGSGSGGY